MLRLLLLLLLALPLSARAAITTTTCTPTVQTGCVVVPLHQYSQARSVAVQVSGTWSGQLEFEGSNDNSTYYRLKAYPVPNGAFVSSTVNNGAWTVDGAGLSWMRVRASSFTSGSAVVSAQPSITAPVGNTEVATLPEPVAIFGSTTTTLTPETIAALGPQPYTLRPSDWVTVGALLAIPVPPDLPDGGPGGMEGRSEIRLVNASATTEVACDPPTPDGGLPEWGVRGTPLFASGGWSTWEVRDNVRVYCRARAGTAPVAPLEKSQ